MMRDIAGGRRAKIICTLGPAVNDDAAVEALMRGGMDAARINMSFGTPEEHIRRIEQVRRLSSGPDRRAVAIIADLPGRKARIGRLKDGVLKIETGDEVRFVRDFGQTGDTHEIPAPEAFFHDSLTPGETVLLSDGLVELRVSRVNKDDVEADVVFGGTVGSRTGLHSSGMPLVGDPVTEEDKPLLELAVKHEVDYLAISWLCDGMDILAVKDKLSELGGDIPIIAKIERPEAFARLDGILRRADAVMIRRGDLGAQIEITRVPLVQKEILRLANKAGVPVIIATQMLGSMIASPRPTRAEASDVANAVADGADGVLLSAETSIGQYPSESALMMGRIIKETEGAESPRRFVPAGEGRHGFADTTASIAVEAANRTRASLIVCFTESGRTAKLVAKYRPRVPILAFCLTGRTRQKLAITWGVRSDELEVSPDIDRMVEQVEERLLSLKLARPGDRLVLIFGAPAGTPGQTNTVRLHRISGNRTVDIV